VKNRMPEIGASGTVRGGDGNIPTYSESKAGQLADREGEKVPGPDIQDEPGIVFSDQV